MKKLTLKQALKTPNIAFIATPEQLKQINTENMCIDKSIPNIIRFDSNCNLCGFSEYINDKTEEWYIKDSNTILVEIVEEEESNTFNSQQEVWQWLVEGNKCLWNNKTIIGFKNGILWNFSREIISNLNTTNLLDFTKYKEPEYITVNGFQVPKPISELPKDLSKNCVYAPSFTSELLVEVFNEHYLHEYLNMLLKREILHLSKEAAITHAKAILGYQA